MRPRAKRTLRWTLLAAAAVLLLAVGAFVWWGLTPLGPSPTALEALQSGGGVRVAQTRDGWEFVPESAEPTVGLIYYPGGHVDARSYAPFAREVASLGYFVAIAEMPLSLAVLSPDAADGVIASRPDIGRWVIAGHSLGGAMAAQYAADTPRGVRGLLLFAAYPADSVDLRRSGLEVASAVGTQDTVVNRENLAAGKDRLPATTEYVILEGGNHAQFGDYGPQPGDTPEPDMSAADQLTAAVRVTAERLAAVAGP